MSSSAPTTRPDADGGYPTLRLAFTDIHPNTPIGKVLASATSLQPAVLIAYPYVRTWIKYRAHFSVRSWALDSGAFTAAASGEPVDLVAYTEFAQQTMANDNTLQDVFALDVIGDWRGTRKNVEWMHGKGVKAIPCWHAGEPEDALLTMARDFPKIAIGGMARMRPSVRRSIVGQVFARVWPKRIHGFGMADEPLLLAYPFHSVDASSWQLGPMRYRQLKSNGGARLRVPLSSLDLTGEVRHYLEIETRAKAHWSRLLRSKP